MGNVHACIERQQRRRHSNKVLYGHPSPVFWLERDVPVPDVMQARAEANRGIPKRVNLYVGTPFCLPTEPDRCGFCLFPSEVYRSRRQLTEYLDYLRREGEMYRGFFERDELANIYFGGGTANLYYADQYAELLRIVRGVFRIPPGIEVTLEGIPQLFSRDKLAAMKAAGVTRISIGVQQLDDALIAMSGRKQKAEQVFRTLEGCRELGLPASVDLIFGWPRQTVDLMLKDLEAIVATGVSHITHYELNVAGRTDFARNRRHELPSTEQNLEMYRVGKCFLESRGYRQMTPYDWEKPAAPLPSSYLYEEVFRTPFRCADGDRLMGFDAWGWGFAGISFFFGAPDAPGWAYMNHTRLDDYITSVQHGRFPVERGFRYTREDLRLHLLFQALQGMRVDRAMYRRLFEVDVVEEHDAIWRALADRGWAAIGDAAVTITGDGVFYTPLIQDLLARDRMDAMRKARATAVDGAPADSIPIGSLRARGEVAHGAPAAS